MLVLGTFLVDPKPDDGARWRLGVQLATWRGWFLRRMDDGTPSSVAHPPP